MRKTKNIWTVKCTATDQDFSVTKHTPNIVLNVRTGDVNIIAEATKKDYDLTFDDKYYKIIDTVEIHDFMNLVKLFVGRSVKYRKVKR